MSTKLKRYLVRLAIDPQQFSDYVADPQAAADKAGLSSQDRAVLLSGDQNRMFAALVASD